MRSRTLSGKLCDYRLGGALGLGTAAALTLGCPGPMPTERALQQQFTSGPAAAAGESKLRYLERRASELELSAAEILQRDAELADANPFARSDPQALSGGATIYITQCAGCHGDNADGRGSSAIAGTQPENFRAAGERFKVTLGVPQDWFDAVANGHGDPVGDGLLQPMPAYEDTLSNEQIWMVLTYLASNE